MTSDPRPVGIPAGLLDAVREVLSGGGSPVRRRALLGELERRGHTVSLAGLNRALDYARRTGLTEEGPEGVRWKVEHRRPDPPVPGSRAADRNA